MYTGVIQRHSEKSWQNKKFYSFALSGQEGWFNTGMKRPPAVGTSVRFEARQNAKGFNEVDGSIEILEDGAAGPANMPKSTGVGGSNNGAGGLSKDAYWSNKEARDLTNDAARELGASRNTAIALIDLALKNEVFKLPAAAKREEFLWGVLDKYTKRLMGKEGDSSAEEKDVSQDNPNTNDAEWS